MSLRWKISLVGKNGTGIRMNCQIPPPLRIAVRGVRVTPGYASLHPGVWLCRPLRRLFAVGAVLFGYCSGLQELRPGSMSGQARGGSTRFSAPRNPPRSPLGKGGRWEGLSACEARGFYEAGLVKSFFGVTVDWFSLLFEALAAMRDDSLSLGRGPIQLIRQRPFSLASFVPKPRVERRRPNHPSSP